MPTKGGKAKAKAKAKTKNTKDTLQTLALSRNAAHHGQQGFGEGSTIPTGSIKSLDISQVSLLARNSFSPFHMRNAGARMHLARMKK